MRVISQKRLKDFWESPGCGDSKGPLQAWYAVVNSPGCIWKNWADLRDDYPSADLVGNCVVFTSAATSTG